MIKVLILDDDKIFCESLADSLRDLGEDQGYIVIPTITIDEALDETKHALKNGNPFNINLIDQRLGPEQDGIEVMQMLHRLNPESDTIIFTGLDRPEEGFKAYQAGAFRYLPKPFQVKELVLLIESIIKWRTVQRERDRSQILNGIAEQALSCSTVPQAAHVLTNGALKLGFERSRLFWFTLDYPAVLTGLCQAGDHQIQGFDGHVFSIAESTYLINVLISKDAHFFRGRELGPGLIEKDFGSSFTPPVGEWALLPLWIGEQFVGAMVLDNAAIDRQIYEEDRRQLSLFARIVAGNLERTRLYENEKSNRERVEDIAIQERKSAQQLDLLQHASVELLDLANQDEENLWFILLTLATADYALGFNRAWIFLAEAGNSRLRGKLGIGHVDPLKAHQDWERDVDSKTDFESTISQLRNGTVHQTPLEELTRNFVVDLGQKGLVFNDVLSSGKRVVLQAHGSQYAFPTPFYKRFQPSTCAVLPFRAGKTPLGLVVVDNRFDGKPILETTLDRLETFLNMAGLVWQNLNQRKQREALLNATYLIMGNVSQDPLGNMLQRICEAARTVIGADWAIIYPLQHEGEPYVYDFENIGYAGKFLLTSKKRNKLRQKGVSAHILRGGTLVVNDVSNYIESSDVRKLAEHKFIRSNKIRALIGTPIRSVEKEEMIGIFYLDFGTSQKFTHQDILQAQSFANLAAIVISNARHAKEASLNLDQERSRGQASQRELEILKAVLGDALVITSETEMIKTLLTNAQKLLDQPGTAPEIILRGWDASLQEEPTEVHFRYAINPEGVIVKTTILTSEEKRIEDVLLGGEDRAAAGKLLVAIRLVETTIGLISIDLNQTKMEYGYWDVLHRFASVAALSLDNVRRQAHLKSVLSAAQALTTQVNLQETFRTIVEVVRQVSPDLSAMTLWYRDPESSKIKWGSYFGVRNTAELQREDPAPGSVVWRVMHAPGPIWASKLPKRHFLIQRFVKEEEIVSVAAFPLKADDHVIGAMFFNYRKVHLFTDEEKTIFTILAEVVASNIRDAVRFEQERKEHQRLDAALRIAEAIEGTYDNLNQFSHKILTVICECFPGANPLLMIYNEDDRLLSFAPYTREFYPIDQPGCLELNSLNLDGPSIASRIARESLSEKQIKTRYIQNVTEDPDYLALISKTRSELCASLVSDEGLLGILVLERPKVNDFEQEDEAYIKYIAHQISLALERVKWIAQLERSNTVATATAWAAELAHDINRDVGAIRHYAYLIREKNHHPEDVIFYAQGVEESAARLASADLLHKTEPRVISLDSSIQKWVSEFAKTRKFAVEFDLNCQGNSILANPTALQRVLRHLVRNAAQATDEANERKLIVRTCRLMDNMVEIQLQDSGPGVDEKIRPLIFQQPIPAKSGQGGYGLLFIRQIIELMGGKIRLLPSRPGCGAIFSIKLPSFQTDPLSEAATGKEVK